MCKKCILCKRINYGGARFQSLHKHEKSDFICRECIKKERKPEAMNKQNIEKKVEA